MSVPICEFRLYCGPGHNSDYAIKYLHIDQACDSGVDS